MAIGLDTLILAIVGGILPAVFWLLFWLSEDAAHPEPPQLVRYVFLLGGLAVVPAYIYEKSFSQLAGLTITTAPIITIIVWAAMEEILKYIAFYLAVWDNKNYDEPVDALVYMITAALGFAALENTLFVIAALFRDGGTSLSFLLTGNFRFIGATIIHIVSSAALGGLVGAAFCLDKARRARNLLVGLVTATALHAAFNYFIITNTGGDIYIFLSLWLLALLVIYFFEPLKVMVCKITDTKPNAQKEIVS